MNRIDNKENRFAVLDDYEVDYPTYAEALKDARMEAASGRTRYVVQVVAKVEMNPDPMTTVTEVR